MDADPEFYVPVHDRTHLIGAAQRVFDLVWRFDFSAPGFALLDGGTDLDSHELRSWMVELKDRLSTIAEKRGLPAFSYRSLARFDQQTTTRFHLDGGPDQSMLMLGYEPSEVRSRLFLADHSRAAFDRNLSPQAFLTEFNPMAKASEDLLAPYATELPQPKQRHSVVLVINNSSLPFTPRRSAALGVLHKAVIINPDPRQSRIVNSTMLVADGSNDLSLEEQREFVVTDLISKPV